MINKNTIISEVVKQNPKIAEILEKHGMGCAKCSIRFEETIEVGAKCHNVDMYELIGEINHLLKSEF